MRKKQSYKNHNPFHPVYHLFIIPLSCIFFGVSVYFFIEKGLINKSWLEAVYFLLGGTFALSVIYLIRQYTSLLQNRMIRQEMRLRYFVVSGKSFNPLENKLSSQQIAALRYASDTELLYLIDVTLHEKLSPTDIKKKIRQWKGDYYQV